MTKSLKIQDMFHMLQLWWSSQVAQICKCIYTPVYLYVTFYKGVMCVSCVFLHVLFAVSLLK